MLFNIKTDEHFTLKKGDYTLNVDELGDELNNYITKNETETLLQGKQDVLTFDDVPTEGSNNPVTSDGLYKTIDDSEHVVSAALNDINQRIGDTYTKTEVDTALF